MDKISAYIESKAKDMAPGLELEHKLFITPELVCRDGFRLSVQASGAHYCIPQRNHGPWTHFEAYPSARDDMLVAYTESGGSLCPRTPLVVIEAVIAAHGGCSQLENL